MSSTAQVIFRLAAYSKAPEAFASIISLVDVSWLAASCLPRSRLILRLASYSKALEAFASIISLVDGTRPFSPQEEGVGS